MNGNKQDIISRHYSLMRAKQTLDFNQRIREKYTFSYPRVEMTIRQAFEKLEGYVDCSDPDMSIPNLVHMFQTAEGIRAAGEPDWLQLVGLIHDMGKILYLWGNDSEGMSGTAEGAQWALGGDTFVVGCRFPDTIVFPEYNHLNPDMHNPLYNTG